MSGAGGKHRAKHLCRKHDDASYEMQDGDEIVQLVCGEGSHYKVVTETGDEILVRLPARFKKVVWIKRDDYLVVRREANEDNGTGGVSAVVAHRLTLKQFKQLRGVGKIPARFLDNEDSDANSADDAWLQGNPNRPPAFDEDDEEEEEEEGEDEEESAAQAK
ncbi:putative RNA-binding protein EIF1AD [Diplonema papillatum]|nr:putative RNA-binding protein EIF1AD [Diplonema papillatum]